MGARLSCIDRYSQVGLPGVEAVAAIVPGLAPLALPRRGGRELLHETRETRLQRGFRRMPEILDDPAAGDQDVADRGTASRKHQMIERGIECAAGHRGVRPIEHEPIGAPAYRNRADRLTDGLRAMDCGIAPKSGPHMRFGCAR